MVYNKLIPKSDNQKQNLQNSFFFINPFSSHQTKNNNHMDEFNFDDIEENTNKKATKGKSSEKQVMVKASKNTKNDDQFDFQVNQKQKSNNRSPKRKNNFEYNNIDAFLDQVKEKQQPGKRTSPKAKQTESTLPRLNLSKSPSENDTTKPRNRMDLSLQQLPEKKVIRDKQSTKKAKKQSEEFDYTVYGEAQVKSNPKVQLKASIVREKEGSNNNKNSGQIAKSSPKNAVTKVSAETKQSKLVEKEKQKPKVDSKKKVQQSQNEDYEEEYQEQIAQQQPKPQVNANKKSPQLKPLQQPSSPKATTQQKNPNANKDLRNKLPSTSKQKPSTTPIQPHPQPPITKYKQLVTKTFPEDPDQQKTKKLKPDAINRLNDKMRDMIKGFSSQLSELIDKNLLLLRRPQNEIKEEIEGEPSDPIEAQIRILEETKKNNDKMMEISQRELQSVNRMNEKVAGSVVTNVHVTEDIQAFRKHIGVISREISNLKNQIEKQGKKVVKLQENSNKHTSNDQFGSRVKSSIEISEKLANLKLEFQKNKKRLTQLNEKEKSLQEKITQVSAKRNDVLQKAENEGITFCSKEEKRRYEELRKKRQQLMAFESKFKSSIKSKQAVIQHEMTDLEVLINDYESRHEMLNQEAEVARDRIFAQISKAKRNPKLNLNTKQILTQLQLFMSSDHTTNQSDQPIDSLNYISENIYKQQPHKNNSKSLTEEKQQKKIAYKNYIQEVARINEEKKAKFTSQRRNSQIGNPFRKAVTPGETSQSKNGAGEREKMNRTKDNNINKAEGDKQRERVWKSSNTQTLIRNPLKRDATKGRYQNTTSQQEQNPLNNKQIMKLIDKNKEKITLKEQQQKNKKPQQQASHSSSVKKPFTFRASTHKDKNVQERINQLADIPKKMEQIEKAIENRRNEIAGERKNYQEEVVGVKLKDKEVVGEGVTMELKPAGNNNTPFKNLKLKKDKENKDKENNETSLASQTKFKIQTVEKPISEQIIEKIEPVKEDISQPVAEDATSFKPKRFNLRPKKQNAQGGGYMPTIQVEKEKQIEVQKPVIKQPQPVIIKPQENKFKVAQKIVASRPVQKKLQEQAFDPFKKFMSNTNANNNKQQKPFTLEQPTTNQPLNLMQSPQPQVNINIKPRINLFSKKQANQPQESTQPKQILLKDPTRKQPLNDPARKQPISTVTSQQPTVQQPAKLINPYASTNKSPAQQQPIKLQRQGRVKKPNLPNPSNKPLSNNIFGDIQDATSNNNILSLGEPQKPHNENNSHQGYSQKPFNKQEKQLNVNDLIGIKKKTFEVDQELLGDLGVAGGKGKSSGNTLGAGRAKAKGGDFFADLDV